MTIPDDWKKTIHRNKLLGMWAAEKLGITGRDAEAYWATCSAKFARTSTLRAWSNRMSRSYAS